MLFLYGHKPSDLIFLFFWQSWSSLKKALQMIRWNELIAEKTTFYSCFYNVKCYWWLHFLFWVFIFLNHAGFSYLKPLWLHGHNVKPQSLKVRLHVISSLFSFQFLLERHLATKQLFGIDSNELNELIGIQPWRNVYFAKLAIYCQSWCVNEQGKQGLHWFCGSDQCSTAEGGFCVHVAERENTDAQSCLFW